MKLQVGDLVYINLYDFDEDYIEHKDWIRYHGKQGRLLERFNNTLWLLQFEDPKGIRGFFERYFEKPSQLLLEHLPTHNFIELAIKESIYGVTQANISSIKMGKTWRHVK